MKILKPILIFSIILCLMPFSFAWMPENHAYFLLDELKQLNEGIALYCNGREDQVMLGLAGADVPVIHYLENNLIGYKGTHSRAWYKNCFNYATDQDLQCTCYGIGLHIVHDRTSHYEFVPKYVRRFMLPQVIIHPLVENNANNQLIKRLKDKPDGVVTLNEIQQASAYALLLYFKDETNNKGDGTANKYQILFNKVSGLNMYNDFVEVSRQLQATSDNPNVNKWAEAVYGKKTTIPTFYWIIAFGLLAYAICALVFTKILGKNWWQIFGYALGGIFLVLGVLITISLIMHTTFSWFLILTAAPSQLMAVEDTTHFDDTVKFNTAQFLKGDGEIIVNGVIVTDASGLEHKDINGNTVSGALQDAEVVGQIVFYILILTFIAFNALIFVKMSK